MFVFLYFQEKELFDLENSNTVKTEEKIETRINLAVHTMLTFCSNLANGGRTDIPQPELQLMQQRQVETPILPVNYNAYF